MRSDHVVVIEADPDLAEWRAQWLADFPAPPIAEIAPAFFKALDEHPEYVEIMRAPTPGAGVPFTDEQRAIVLAAVAAARQHGLARFPSIVVRFHYDLPCAVLGLARGNGDHARVDLAAHLAAETLRWVTLHEAGHTRDDALGLVLPYDESERRADAFAAAVTVLAGWTFPQMLQ